MNRCNYHQSYWINLIVFFSFTISINAQNPTNWQLPYDTDEYTVALWHFDEMEGNIVADAGPNNYYGLSTNTDIIISMNGFGNAREFLDNPIGYITFGNFNLPQFEGTLEYWINPSIRPVTGCDHSHFFVKGTHGNAGSGFTFYNRLYNDTDVDYGVGDSGGDIGRRFENAFNYNEWQHIAFTWSTVETKMYVNGELISVMDPFPIGIGQSNDEVALGKWGSQLYTECRYLGYIDELRISNIERTFEPSSALVAYYPFNGNANDESGNGNDGIVNGAKLTNDRFENINSAYYFDGIDDEIILGSEPFNFINHSYSISVWAYWERDPTLGTHIFDKQGYPVNGGGGYRLYTGGNGELVFSVSNDVTGTGFVDYNTHLIPDLYTWYHVVANVDVTGSTTVYIDSEAKVTDLSLPLIGNEFELKLGTRIDFNNSRFGGIIDDVRIYNTTLTEAEILELYHEGGWTGGHGLVAYYPFNGNANDESGNGNDGTVNGPILTTDIHGNSNSAYFFDGNDDYIDCGNNQKLDQTGSLTMSAWFQLYSLPTELNTDEVIVGKWRFDQNNNSYILNIDFDTSNNFQLVTSNCPTPEVIYGGQVTKNDWYHYVGVIDQDQELLKIYVNGILTATDAYSGQPSCSNNENLMIGKINDFGGNNHLHGVIDEVRIYDRALSEAEILDLYHEGGGGTNNTISVHSPNGGEVWGMGTEQSITWSSIDVIDVKIEFSSNNGATWNLVTESTPSTGIYLWTVPAIHTIQALVKITDVADEENNDQSDDPFTIEPVTSADIFNSTIPDQFELKQNYPNPFNPITTIYYGLPYESSVRILIFDILGSNVMRFTKDNQPAGYHTIKFDASNLPSGIYFYQIQASGFNRTKKMILLK
ncbi:MAG: T9SS type A sorting domain-containing protein [Bacteroidetes bacterium]|nr:T9SS type A sorting domain-containing protein [Bacteroidota bacterium]